MPSSVPLAAVRILRPLQGHRLLSSNNLAALSNIQQAEEEHDRALYSDPTDPITLSNECDRTKSIDDLQNQLLKADFTDIEIVPVSLRTIVEVSDALAKEMKTYNDRGEELVVFQLCDGTGKTRKKTVDREGLKCSRPFFFFCLFFVLFGFCGGACVPFLFNLPMSSE